MKHVNTSPSYTLAPLTRQYVENFYDITTTQVWTTGIDAGGTIARGVGGGVVATTDNTDNDEFFIYTTGKVVPGTTSSVSAEFTGRIKSDVLTTLSLFIGLGSTFGADMLADTIAIPATNYFNGLLLFEGETRLRYLSVHNATATVNKELNFAPTAGQFFSYRLHYQYNQATMTCTVEIDPLGGQDFKPVGEYLGPPIHPAFFSSDQVYGAFPAAGLNYGVYGKQGAAAHVVTWDYTAWAVGRT